MHSQVCKVHTTSAASMKSRLHWKPLTTFPRVDFVDKAKRNQSFRHQGNARQEVSCLHGILEALELSKTYPMGQPLGKRTHLCCHKQWINLRKILIFIFFHVAKFLAAALVAFFAAPRHPAMDSKVSSEENDAPNYVKLKKRATTVSPRRIRNEWVIKIKSLMEKADLLGRDAPIDIDFSTWKELEKVLRRRVMETVQSYDLFRSETLDIAKSNLCDNTERLVTITLDKGTKLPFPFRLLCAMAFLATWWNAGSVELKAHIAEELFVPSLRATVSLDDVGLSVEVGISYALLRVIICRHL